MNFVIQFIENHWQLLCELLISLVTLIILCAKKQVKVTDSNFASLLLKLPSFIKEAEDSHPEASSGKAKLVYVFQLAVKYLCEITNYDQNKVIATYGAAIYDAVESILSTPTKKEVI